MNAPFLTNSKNPLLTAHQTMLAKLTALQVPAALPTFPTPSGFRAILKYFSTVAEIADEIAHAVGLEVADNATFSVDMGLFTSPFAEAIQGNATYEISQAAEHAAEGCEEEDL